VILLTFLAYIVLIVVLLSVAFVIGIFLFDSIEITFPNKHILKVTKK